MGFLILIVKIGEIFDDVATSSAIIHIECQAVKMNCGKGITNKT